MKKLSAALLCAVHAEEELASGIYTIKNQADGTYLNAFDFAYAKDGYAYTAKYSGEEGENILLIRQDDGTYLLYPQSESGKYAFLCLSVYTPRASGSQMNL